MSTIAVSIIIPVFNTENYLSTCLDSVLNQTLGNIEIICINDGSTDSSLEILKNYQEMDHRIKIIDKDNEGQGIARNIGIDNAVGEYIAFVDSDDFIKKDMLEKLYNSSKKSNLDLVMCKVASYNELTNEINDSLWYYSLGIFKDFEKNVFSHKDTMDFTCEISVTPYNKLYKNSFIKKHNIKFAENLIFEDEVFFYDVYLKANKVSIVDETLYYYRINREGSTVEKTEYKDYSDIVPIFKLIIEKFIETNNWDDYKVNVSNRFIHLMLWRYSQTSKKYRKSFFYSLKELLIQLLEDNVIKNNLSLKIKHRVDLLVNSVDYDDFVINDKYKLFSIVMACYNVENYISDAIESVINQSFGFESNVELILVDDGSTDKTSEICLSYVNNYPDNIKYFYQENQGQASARNLGLKHINGKYVNFLDSDDTLRADTLEYVFPFFEKHFDDIDLVSIPIRFFERQKGDHKLNYKYKTDKVVDLNKFWCYPQLSASSAFFKSELFDKFEFDTNLVSSEDSIMVNKILLEKMAYGVVKKGAYNYRKRFDESSTIDTSNKSINFYNNRLKNYFINLINYSLEKYSLVPKFIQYMIIYDIQWIFYSNNVQLLLAKNNESEEFYNNLKYIAKFLDDEIILKHRNVTLNVKNYLLKSKYDSETSTKIEDGDVVIYVGDILLDRLSIHKFWLDIIEIKRNTLYISGMFKSFFDKNKIEIVLTKEINDEIFEYPSKCIEYSDRISDEFSESIINFDFEVPLSEDKQSVIGLYVKYSSSEDVFVNLEMDFLSHARMSKVSNYSIWDNYLIKYYGKGFVIKRYHYFNMIKSEISVLKNIFIKKGPYWTSALIFRFLYLLLFPFYRNKKIWLFMDRRHQADDNAEHLYKYSIKQNDRIKKYYTICEDSNDFNRLKNLDNIVPFYSIKQRLIYLFADKIISSHPDENILNPFWGKNIKYYSGLINSGKIFLQHGVTKDDISMWLKKYDKNIELLVTVSEIERNSFYQYKYNYNDGVVQVLGFPRFDGLENISDKKQILIMPSWRENLSYTYKSQINKSEYFKKINSLINNEKLVNLAKEYGYKIIFKPHPKVYEFIDLFNKKEEVIFDESTRYQELFNNSSILITDYSSVAFDFSYNKKPIVYYQYGDDYNFKNRYFNYETMGFGEVTKDEGELIDIIEEYLKTDCNMKEVYNKRVDNFYMFNDKNNCKRVYEAIRKL